jgi:uncharacterized damage-inducible protein DinB
MTSTTFAAVLTRLFNNNHQILLQQVKDITQEESLLQPPFRGNCLNWVVGHILGVYGECLEVMGMTGTQNEAEVKTYGYGSEALTDCAKAGELPELLHRLDEGLERITLQLASMSAGELEREVTIWLGPVSLIEALFVMQWHASYHTGQLELLRQLAGKNDKVI